MLWRICMTHLEEIGTIEGGRKVVRYCTNSCVTNWFFVLISIDLTGGVRKTPSIAEEEEVEEPVRSETPREESPPPVKPGHAGQYIYRVLDITISEISLSK